MDAGPSRAEEIFGTASDIADPKQRNDYLDQACGGDHALREEVESLLAVHLRTSDFLEPPPAMLAGTLAEDEESATAEVGIVSLSEKEGERIGRYKLLERIGEGGFGVVWMAEQEEPVRRRVALKVIKLGMDTRQVVARFEAERQALAM